MKKDTKIYICLVIIVLLIISGIYLYKNLNKQITSETFAKCVGQKSILYVQQGCSHCIDQENLFGDTYKYLTTIDCHFDSQKCIEAKITGTPTWIINNKSYTGFKTIEELKELTGC